MACMALQEMGPLSTAESLRADAFWDSPENHGFFFLSNMCFKPLSRILCGFVPFTGKLDHILVVMPVFPSLGFNSHNPSASMWIMGIEVPQD